MLRRNQRSKEPLIGTSPRSSGFLFDQTPEEDRMKKYLVAAALACAVAAPAMADEVGVRAGPVGAGVTVGQDRDHDRTIVKEHEPESKTVIKKEDSEGNREKTVIHHDRD
jgi:hypothetical protein